ALKVLGGRFDVPLDQRSAEALGNLEREHGLAGPGLALDQQRTLERDGGIDRDLEVVGCDIGAGSFKTHRLSRVERQQYRRKRAQFNRMAAASHRHRTNVSRIAARGESRISYIPFEAHEF